jgi:hypothetical protein
MAVAFCLPSGVIDDVVIPSSPTEQYVHMRPASSPKPCVPTPCLLFKSERVAAHAGEFDKRNSAHPYTAPASGSVTPLKVL